MKLIHATLLFLIGNELAAALPATAATFPTQALQPKPKPTEKPQCYARCTEGYHSFSDPKTGKCGCVPDDKGKQECLQETICVEYDVPMRPLWDEKSKTCSCVPDDRRKQECLEETICVEYDVPMGPIWDESSKTCSCKPKSNAETICIAATTCSRGSSPKWNPKTQQCQCLKINEVSNPPKPNVTPRSTSSPTKVSTITPAPTVDRCTLLKTFCECGDHHMHWSEEQKSCQCPPCGPVVTLGCENLLVYCPGGDHKMHLNPVTKKCECPLV